MLVTHRITIGTEASASPDTSRLVRLRVRASLYEPVKYAEASFAPPDGLSLQPGDDLKVELGADRNSAQVFSGKIARVEWGFGSATVLAESQMSLMTATRVNLAFERPTAGDIVSALCQEAGVQTGQVQPGLSFAAYAVGSNRSAYDHARRLAVQCGFDLYADPDDKVVFAKAVPTGQPRLLQYGTTVLAISLSKPSDGAGAVDVFGESPASFGKGDEAAPWLTKKDVKGSAPATGGGVAVQATEPAARTVQNAQQMARNLQSALKSRIRARAQLVGTPDVRLNEIVQIAQMPLSDLNGTFRVTGVEHTLRHGSGFVTELDLVSTT
jgi:hypothetical protein